MKQKNYEKNSDYNKIIAQAFNSINKNLMRRKSIFRSNQIDKKLRSHINLSNLYLIKNDTSSSINCLFDF